MHDDAVRRKVTALRRSGRSIGEIHYITSLPESTIAGWIRGIKLSECGKLRLEARKLSGRQNGHEARRVTCRTKREQWQAMGQKDAKVGNLKHAMGCMAYWCEGTKGPNAVSFVNSDPSLLKTFFDFLTTYFDVRPTEIRLNCNCYTNNGLTVEEIKHFWSTQLPGCSIGTFRTDVAPVSKVGTKKKRHVYGVGSLVLCRTDVVQRIYGAIQEYSGYSSPEWLEARIRTKGL
jgi:hypothetical protein